MQVSKHKDKQVIYKYIFSNGYLPDFIASTRRESTVKYLLRGTDNVQRQISEHIFYSSKVAIVFIILQIFFTTRKVLKDGEDHAEIPQFLGHIQSRDAFRPIAWKQNVCWIISSEDVCFEEQLMSKDKYPSTLLKAQWRPLCLLSFKYFSQHAGSSES